MESEPIATEWNDLFRKFRDYFIKLTERDFDPHFTDCYISVDPKTEESIADLLHAPTNEIIPIVGPTGIGKTCMLMHCLKTYYNTDEIPHNNPLPLKKENEQDLIFYSDFNLTLPGMLKKPDELVDAKVKALVESIKMLNGISDIDIDHHLKNKCLEVEYYSTKEMEIEKDIFVLSLLLSLEEVNVNSLVLVLDDLESLDADCQHDIMRWFLLLYEHITKTESKHPFVKLVFCLRNNTYFNIYNADIYNTHRSLKAFMLEMPPQLCELFEARFNCLMTSGAVRKPQNIDSWKKAKEVLLSICKRIDKSYSYLLLMANNNNVGNALNDFIEILRNRRWTQRNMNPQSSFVIEDSDYSINDTTIIRAICLKERSIFKNTPLASIRNIFPNPGVNLQIDLLSILILRALQYDSDDNIDMSSGIHGLLSENELIDSIIDIIMDRTRSTYFQSKQEVERKLRDAFTYYKQNRLIKKNTDPAFPNSDKVFLLPRGSIILKLFFSRTILFTIFRDDFLMDDSVFNTKCSYQLSHEELLYEALKYEERMIENEEKMFERITINNRWIEYFALFGKWSFSESFLNAIKNSAYYIFDKSVPDRIDHKINALNSRVKDLVATFEQQVSSIPIL